MSFDVREVIRRALDESDSPDPKVVADRADKMIYSRDVREALRQLLPEAVRQVIHTLPAATVASGTPVNGRRDVGDMTRDPWRHQQWVPGIGWKFAGDITPDDCDRIADDRERRAAENETQAKAWRLLGQKIRDAGGDTWRDLGDDEGPS